MINGKPDLFTPPEGASAPTGINPKKYFGGTLAGILEKCNFEAIIIQHLLS